MVCLTGLEMALNAAANQAHVLYVFEKAASVRELLGRAEGAPGVASISGAEGTAKISMTGGGAVRVLSLSEDYIELRGVAADVVFASPSFWERPGFREQIRLVTAGTPLFHQGPLFFSTFQRIGID